MGSWQKRGGVVQVMAAVLLFAGVGVLSVHAEEAASTESLSELLVALTREVSLLEDDLLAVQNRQQPGELAPEQVRDIIESSISWFREAQEENGHFRYEYHPYSNEYTSDDHVVRQAGALYALGGILRRDREDPYGVSAVIDRGIDFMKGRTIEGTHEDQSFSCILGIAGGQTCFTAAAALTLISLIDRVEASQTPRSDHLSLIRAYRNNLVAMQLPSGGYRNYYYSHRDTQSDGESSFTNGEVLLALVRYAAYDPNDTEVTELIARTLAYLTRGRETYDFGLYLWAMAAIKELSSTDYLPQSARLWAEGYTTWRIDSFASRRWSQHNMCAYVEGLASARSFALFENDADELIRLDNEINHWLNRSRHLQVLDRDTIRLIRSEDDTVLAHLKIPSRAYGGFLTGRNELTQRIDFTQHCMSSYVQDLVDLRGQKIAP
jgi:hypothetical protein